MSFDFEYVFSLSGLFLLLLLARLSLLHTYTQRDRSGRGKESVCVCVKEVVVGSEETSDHLLAKKPSGDLWPWRRNRREEWADALHCKLSVHVSQAADKCATIADKEQNDNTWRGGPTPPPPPVTLLFSLSLSLFKSQLLLLDVVVAD
jgi:hypothetical protein